MGDYEARPSGFVESMVKYHPYCVRVLTRSFESTTGTVPAGQFDWGGFLPKSNGGVQRFPQRGRQSRDECKRTRELDCETDKSSRYESRG